MTGIGKDEMTDIPTTTTEGVVLTKDHRIKAFNWLYGLAGDEGHERVSILEEYVSGLEEGIEALQSTTTQQAWDMRSLEATVEKLRSELISSDEKNKLERFASLEENWDSYGARAVTNIAITIAAELLGFAALINHTPAIDIRTHTFVPLADGGLQIGWSGPGGELDVEISPDGDLGYLFDRAGNEYEFDNVDAVTIQRLIASVGQEQ